MFIQSRDLRPLDRYFPELHATFLDALPPGSLDLYLVERTARGYLPTAVDQYLRLAAAAQPHGSEAARAALIDQLNLLEVEMRRIADGLQRIVSVHALGSRAENDIADALLGESLRQTLERGLGAAPLGGDVLPQDMGDAHVRLR